MKMTRVMVAVAVTLLFSSICMAGIKLPSVIGHDMVLQRDMKLPIWGWATPGKKVTITFAGKSASAVTDAKGNWKVTIGPLVASSTPMKMVVAGENRITLKNILVGEVWLCSGQSNMQWSVKQSKNYKAERADADNYPNIRLCTVVGMGEVDKPQKNSRARWVVCDSNSVSNFSGVGYFFGRQLYNDLKVPIGLIDTAVSGTLLEAWTSREVLDSVDFLRKAAAANDRRVMKSDHRPAMRKHKQLVAKWEKTVAAIKAANAKRETAGKKPKPFPRRPWPPQDPRTNPNRPAALYNSRIAPTIPLAIRGVLWYQGESNAPRARQYRTSFPLMINDWRKRWGQGDFPFLFVQLATYRDIQTTPVETDATFPPLREAQVMTLSLPNTAMACTIDLADAHDPRAQHPTNKQDVGKRLTLAARAIAYGQKLVYSGPMYKAGSMKINGAKVSLKFDHIGSGLVARGGDLKGFAIAGADRKWVWAQAKIEGDSVIVSSPQVPAPVAVRYSWAMHPIGNLYNKEKLPASPFRTDDWKYKLNPKR